MEKQFSQIFLGCIFFLIYIFFFFFFGGGGGGGGQITASFTCGLGLTEIIEGDFTCWWLSFVMFKARICLLVDLGTLLL